MKVQQADLVRQPFILENPTLLKIKTIKKKFLEQMRLLPFTHPIPELDKLKVVGKCGSVIVLVHEGIYVRMHEVGWQTYLMGDVQGLAQEDYSARLKEVQNQLDIYTQIFQD